MIATLAVIAVLVGISIGAVILARKLLALDDVDLPPVDWERFTRDIERWAAAQRDLARPDERGQRGGRADASTEDPAPDG